MITPGHRHPAAAARRAAERRRVPLRPLEVDLRVLPGGQGARHRRLQPRPGDGVPAAAGGGGAGVPDHRHLLQAPAHRHRPDQRLLQAAAQGARRAAAGHRRRRQADRLHGRGEPVRGHRLRQGQDRGLHLEGLPRLRHLHRVRPLPVPVPGLEHRQAAVAEAGDHGPARPPVRQGPVPDRRQGPCPTTRVPNFGTPAAEGGSHGTPRAGGRLPAGSRAPAPEQYAAPAGRRRRLATA